MYVEVPGSLVTLRAKPGSEVKAGDLMAELENTDLELSIAQLAQQRGRQAAQLQSLERLRFSDRQALRQISQVRESLRSSEEQLAKRLADRRRLLLTAPCDGWVLPPPELPAKTTMSGHLQGWSGTPLADRNLNCLLATKTLFCQIGDLRKLEAALVIDQADVDAIAAHAVSMGKGAVQ